MTKLPLISGGLAALQSFVVLVTQIKKNIAGFILWKSRVNQPDQMQISKTQ